MMKSALKYTKTTSHLRIADATAKIVDVKKAAQRPTHASLAVIVKRVRSVAASREASA